MKCLNDYNWLDGCDKLKLIPVYNWKIPDVMYLAMYDNSLPRGSLSYFPYYNSEKNTNDSHLLCPAFTDK